MGCLSVEQVLMRSMKISGGLTKRDGMTELQHLTRLLSMPACAEVNNAMQELTGVNHNTSEQNKDMTKARQSCDMTDTRTVQNYLQERNSFCSDPSLRSVSPGVHAHPTVNVDKKMPSDTASWPAWMDKLLLSVHSRRGIRQCH